MKDTPRDGVTVYNDAHLKFLFFFKVVYFSPSQNDKLSGFIRLKKKLTTSKRLSCIVG